MTWDPCFLALMWIGMIPCGFIFLITWRIARRFGGRGLAVVICVVAVVGPLRDSWYMAMFPEWGSDAPGYAPRLWHFVMTWEPCFLALMWIGMVPCGFIFLITWRIARRFGGRGLAVVICVVAVVGPLRRRI